MRKSAAPRKHKSLAEGREPVVAYGRVVPNPLATIEVRAAFAGTDGVWMDDLDGLTVARGDWWFNLRPSNTEPLLRLNVEAPDEETLIDVRDQVLRIVHDE